MAPDLETIFSAVRDWYNSVEDFVLDMTVELAHDYLFLTQHFPIFFILQSLGICVLVRRNNPKYKWYQSVLAGTAIALSGRAIFAAITQRRPPLLENPLYFLVFGLIWLVVNASPADFVYRILNSSFISFLYQLFYPLVQIRESTHGVDIALRSFPNSIVGSILASAILSSTECVAWRVFCTEPCREFSSTAALRNAAIAGVYLAITQYPELFNEYIDTERELVKIVTLGVVTALSLLNMIIFKIKGYKELDVTLLSYIGKIFSFHGDSVSGPK